MRLQNYQIIPNLRNFSLALIQILRHIDHKVSHLLQLIDYIHIINAGLVASASVLDALDLLISEMIAQIVDVVLCCIGIRNFFKSSRLSIFEIGNHDSVRPVNEVDHSIQLLKGVSVECLLMHISA